MNSNLDNLVSAFNKMEGNGWDVTKDLKWGFFFVDSHKQNLYAVFEELKEHGYIMEEIYLIDNKWTLQVSKIDTLTPEKLFKRNNAFNELAEYCHVEFYDGWDVERIEA